MGERQRVTSGSPYEGWIGFSRAVRVGRQVHVSGTGPIEADGSCADSAAAQARRCLDIILGALAESGGEARHVVRTRIYVTDRAHIEPVGRVHGEMFGDVRPACTIVVVAALADPDWLVEIEAEAILPSD